MEAATPLRPASVRLLGDRLVADGLVIEDPTAVTLVRERAERGDDPAAVVVDAVEIGARVLGREQTAVDTGFVRVEFERAARELESAFADRARTVADQLSGKVDEVFGPESGTLQRALDRHFSDDSSGAVQHRVRALVDELLRQQREGLVRLFASSEGHNPLADFKAASVAAIRRAGEQQDSNLRAMGERMAELGQELQALRDEREKRGELEIERDRGTAKGREFEEEVVEALDAIAAGQGDDCDAVGDVRAGTGKVGDVVVGIDACRGPARGRIVFEAKNRQLSKPKALAELDAALDGRAADFAVLVVPAEEKVPARLRTLREYNGDKLVVVYDPDDPATRMALEVAYALARARVLMARAESEGIDAGAVSDAVERALATLDDARRIKQQLTGASTGIEQARGILEGMERQVRTQLAEIDGLLRAGGASPAAPRLALG